MSDPTPRKQSEVERDTVDHVPEQRDVQEYAVKLLHMLEQYNATLSPPDAATPTSWTKPEADP